MAGDVVRIKTGVEMTSVSGSAREDVVEIPRADWDAMTAAEREAELDSIARSTFENEVNVWAFVDGED
jgi:hypothetical protein